ncbi:MAG: hypothetical protein JWP37_2195 [Mucilaginibacter sp.]|nr:hypothetical protein [Mucilaginibacter sp.]
MTGRDPKSGKPARPKSAKMAGAEITKPEENNSTINTPQSTTQEPSTYNSQPATSPSQPATEMEVHHHPQLEHKPKPWKEYFLEFLMIFLAVTMGFFAETIRENISESGKAKELAKSLYQEVYADSINMQGKITMRTEKDNQLNYFRRYMKDSSLNHLSAKFYPSFTWSFVLTSTIIFDPNDGVLNQLRNSGTLRYFKGIELQNCISRMNVATLNVRNRNNQEYAFVEQFTRPFLLKHYDFKFQDDFTQNGKLSILQAIKQINYHSVASYRIRNSSDFKRDDAEALAAYYLLIIRATKQVFYTPYVDANHKLLQTLRKEYNFTND